MNAHQRRKFTRAAPKPGDRVQCRVPDWASETGFIVGVVHDTSFPDAGFYSRRVNYDNGSFRTWKTVPVHRLRILKRAKP